MPRVTVIIPSYNHEKFVGEAIQSVLDQTYQDFELVITDDGSTDKTVEIIKSFTDTRIRLFCFERNQGACVAANKCVSEAKGEFIAMLSSDDIFAPEKLEKQVNFLDKNPEIGAVFGFAEIIDKYGNEFQDENHFYKHIFIQPNRTRFEWLNYFFFRLNCLCHPSVLIRKKCYDHIGSYDERFAQLPDLDFWIRLCLKYEIYIIPENLIKFRVLQNETNASGDKPTKHIRQSLEITQILKNYLKIEVNDNLLKIFPDILIDITSLETELAPFYIAMLALQVGNPAYKFFAIDTIYKIFNNKNLVIKIKQKYSFDFSNLIMLTGEQDVFSIISMDKLQHTLQQAQSELQQTKIKLKDSKLYINDTGFIKTDLVNEYIEYPLIKPVHEENNRPFWSVIIPVYNNTKYLEQTLKSVLEQAPTSEVMQIEVVDDCSTQGDVEEIVQMVGKGRVNFYRQPKNLGFIGNWNACIQRARGYWVHILHQDDIVMPGFYNCFQASLEKETSIGAAFCRHSYIDKNTNWLFLSLLERETSGILSNWLELIATMQRVQFPAIVVRRSTYEKLGGFCPEAGSAADWEMWKRIAVNYPIWYEPQILACFRLHSASESSRLNLTGTNIADTRKAIDISQFYLPEKTAADLSAQAREYYAFDALSRARQMLDNQDIAAAIALIREGLKCSNSPQLMASLASLLTTSEANPLLHLFGSFLLSTEKQQIAASIISDVFDKEEDDYSERFNLKDINLVIFPDWQQAEELLYEELTNIMKMIVTCQKRDKISLLIDNSNISDEDANFIISDVIWTLLQTEDLENIEEPEISLVGNLSEREWKYLLPNLQARISLQQENKKAICQAGVENLSYLDLQDLENWLINKANKLALNEL